MKKKAAPSSPGKSDDQRSYKKDASRKPGGGGPRPYKKEGDRPGASHRKRSAEDGRKEDRPSSGDRPKRSFEKGDKFADRKSKPRPPFREDRPKKAFGDRPKPASGEDRPKRPYSKDKESRPFDKERPEPKRAATERPARAGEEAPRPVSKRKEEKPVEAPMTLNKYVAHSGECSRRAAAEMVKQGKVRVNGELVLDPGYRVEPGDQITLGGKKLTPQKNLVYILLNKPKDFITTTDDPEGRKTVMDLVESAEVGRVYPIGRLDRNTTGLLLLTNDGVLAQKLSHPSHNVRKVYQVTLDKNLTRADYDKIVKGFELEDGMVEVDALAYLETRHELGIEIHSGKNRIVRRIFESLGYVVEKLDRVSYAGLTKKNLPRGKWRFLDEKETILLKHFKN